MAGYPGCKFCNGRGCLACPGEKMKVEEREAERRLNKKPLSESEAHFMQLLVLRGGKRDKTGQLRYENGIYRDCPKCDGLGCVSCPEEADAEYARQFPDGPKPIATFTHEELENPETLARLRGALGPGAITKAYGPGGGGDAEVISNLAGVGSAVEYVIDGDYTILSKMKIPLHVNLRLISADKQTAGITYGYSGKKMHYVPTAKLLPWPYKGGRK